jgi:hypothetical protein
MNGRTACFVADLHGTQFRARVAITTKDGAVLAAIGDV